MFPTIFDRIYHQVDLNTKKILAPYKRKKLGCLDFTIISNNCWGGVCYEHFGLQKLSPTIGMYFYPDDYLKLISNLQYYFSLEMKVVSSDKSKQFEILLQDNAQNFYVGQIGDIEAILVHYKDPLIAVEKWNRRKKRVNMDNLVFKFCQQNGCTKEHLRIFDKLDLPGKKIMFVNQKNHSYKSGVYYHGFEKVNQISNDTFYWDRYFDVYDFLNGKGLHTKR